MIHADSQAERKAWIDAIREAKSQLFSDRRTLNTVEEHTMRRHRRRSIQAVPFSSGLKFGNVNYSRSSSIDSTGESVESLTESVESYTAAVWVSDKKAEKCMRCQEPFTLFRRRHHCRLCGVVCCHYCSTKVSRAPYVLLDPFCRLTDVFDVFLSL